MTYFEPITQAQATETVSAFLRTIAIGRWGFEHTQLAFLRGSCLAAPLSGAEAGDISVAEQAQSMGGHAMWDPEPVFVGIAVRPVPSGLADRIQQQTAVQPDRTVVTVENSGAIWIVDNQGKKIKQIGTGAPGQRVLGVTVGTIRRDRIGERLWEQAFFRCTDPEVAGACDGIS